MKFIELTTRNTGKAIFININQIESVAENSDYGSQVFTFGSSEPYIVEESVKCVMDLISR